MQDSTSASKSAIYRPSVGGAIRQGEIVTNIIQLKLDLKTINDDPKRLTPVIHPIAIIVSQDCDLDWDYRARQGQADSQKNLPNVLFCSVARAEDLRTQDGINSSIWKQIQINKNERYHFFQKVAPAQDAIHEGLPEMGVDFKIYFTLPADEVYKRLETEAKRRCCLVSPYLEHFASRFYYFQSRIALPEEHFSEPGK